MIIETDSNGLLNEFRGLHYILDKDRNVLPASFREWMEFMTSEEGLRRRIIRQEVVRGLFVSTVFLGLNHTFRGGPPLIFETMAFGAGDKSCQWRCSTLLQAEEIHQSVCHVIESRSARLIDSNVAYVLDIVPPIRPLTAWRPLRRGALKRKSYWSKQ